MRVIFVFCMKDTLPRIVILLARLLDIKIVQIDLCV